MDSTGTVRVRDRWLVVLAGLGFAVACLAANAARRPNVQHYSTAPIPTPRNTRTNSAAISDQFETNRASHWHLGAPDWLVRGLLTLLLTAGALLVILLIVRLVPRLGRRLPRRRTAEEPVEYAPANSTRQLVSRVTDALDDTLAVFRRGDRQRAIIACWIRLEQIAEEAGFGRLSSETSSELATRWLKLLPVSRQPLLTLAELYREARYSSHPLDESALVTARGALEQLRREISTSASAIRNVP